MNTLELSKLKEYLLQEIGDASKKPYDYEIVIDDDNHRVYNFETDLHTYYEVDVKEIEPKNPLSDDGIKLNINFGITNEEGIKSTKIVSNKGELYAVMSTVMTIVKDDLSNHKYIKELEFQPEKRAGKDTNNSNTRAKLYTKFIKGVYKDMPDENIITEPDGTVRVKLKW